MWLFFTKTAFLVAHCLSSISQLLSLTLSASLPSLPIGVCSLALGVHMGCHKRSRESPSRGCDMPVCEDQMTVSFTGTSCIPGAFRVGRAHPLAGNMGGWALPAAAAAPQLSFLPHVSKSPAIKHSLISTNVFIIITRAVI